MSHRTAKCAQTPKAAKIELSALTWLDCRAAMLQAIRIGRGVPMLEPWIIDEIRRREEERRRGDRPQLELPVPDGQWPGESDPGMVDVDDERGDRAPERGVAIIGM
jgi:hypothetical protein